MLIKKLDIETDSTRIMDELSSILNQHCPWPINNQIGIKYRNGAQNIWTDGTNVSYNKRVVGEEIDYVNNLDNQLYTKIKQNLYLEYKNNKNDFFNLIESLQTNVKNELIWIIYQSNWKDLKFFQNTPNNFILHSLPYLKSHKVLKGETLFSFGEYIEEMYFVVKGCLSLHLDKNVNYFEVGQITSNNHFGEIMLLYGIQSVYELRCKSKEAEVLVLKKEDQDYLMLKGTP
jgi:hypothetical protein